MTDKFWSKANFFSAHAVAGIVEGLLIGVGITLGVGLWQIIFMGGETFFG